MNWGREQASTKHHAESCLTARCLQPRAPAPKRTHVNSRRPDTSQLEQKGECIVSQNRAVWRPGPGTRTVPSGLLTPPPGPAFFLDGAILSEGNQRRLPGALHGNPCCPVLTEEREGFLSPTLDSPGKSWHSQPLICWNRVPDTPVPMRPGAATPESHGLTGFTTR